MIYAIVNFFCQVECVAFPIFKFFTKGIRIYSSAVFNAFTKMLK